MPEGTGFYPLPAHLFDAALYADVLVREWLPAAVVDRLGCALDGDVRRLLVAGAALHDLGKATPVFQGQLHSPFRDRWLDGHLAMLGGGDGATVRGRALKGVDGEHVARRHEAMGAVMLATGLLTAVEVDDVRMIGTDGVGALVAGHHGNWDALPDQMTRPFVRYLRALVDSPWSALAGAVYRQVATFLADHLEVDLDAAVRIRFADAAFIPVAAAVVTVADWLASNHADRVMVAATIPTDVAGYDVAGTREAAGADVRGLLGVTCRTTAGLDGLFDYRLDRPVQQRLASPLPQGLDGRGASGLRIVQVPTGEGKTEAALAHWIVHAGERQGLYFALPTMATATAMFDRVQAMFERYGTANLAALTHSTASLNAFYQQPAVASSTATVDQDGSKPGGLVAGQWLTGRHRPLLAPIAVGTVDQLLAGTVRNAYGNLRLLAAATKTVVLDEVHSYSPFMQELLVRFLQWAGLLHVDVVMLTATLPHRLHDRYVNAYLKGAGHGPGGCDRTLAYPKLTTATPDGVCEQLPVAMHGAHRTVRMHYLARDATGDKVRELARTHRQARIGVIVNTVARAQTLGSELADLDPMVLHARFPARVRHQRTLEVLDRFGRTRPDGGPQVLIATQLAEQSLNIDVDYELTDLCPAPSLIQRIGRCRRYPQLSRPDGQPDPVVYVLVPEVPFNPGVALPYSPVELGRCHEVLAGRSTLAIPNEVQQLLDDTYLSFDDVIDAQSSGTTHDADDIDGYLLDLAVEKAAASEAMIPSPELFATDVARRLVGYVDARRHPTRLDLLGSQRVVLVGDHPDLLGADRIDDADLDELADATVTIRPPANARTLPARPGRPTDLLVLDVRNAPAHRYDPQLGLLTGPQVGLPTAPNTSRWEPDPST